MIASKILIVDDEPQLRRVIRASLTRQGYIAGEARSGETAIDLLHEEEFQLVLLDRNMPGMGGLEACRKIRDFSDVGIIMLTVRKAEEDRIEALDAGADDYVTKPFSMPELLARIRANLRRIPRAKGSEAALMEFDGIRIDMNSRHVRVQDKDVRLTPKQFEVLHYLVSNPNISLRHAQILRAVWGPEYGDEIEYLHVVINQLRKKIEPNPSLPRYILTEPWFGYRFNLPQ